MRQPVLNVQEDGFGPHSAQRQTGIGKAGADSLSRKGNYGLIFTRHMPCKYAGTFFKGLRAQAETN